MTSYSVTCENMAQPLKYRMNIYVEICKTLIIDKRMSSPMIAIPAKSQKIPHYLYANHGRLKFGVRLATRTQIG